MINSFSFSNFRSFKEPQEIYFSKGKTTSDCERSDGVTVVCGSTNSGKTNFIESIRFFSDFIIHSCSESSPFEKIGVEPFRLSSSHAESPSTFNVIFTINNFEYEYGFNVSQSKVFSEHLYKRKITTGKKGTKLCLFTRDEEKIVVSQKHFKGGKGLERMTRKNALFLSACACFAEPESTTIVSFFQSIKFFDGDDLSLVIENLKSPSRKKMLIDSLERYGVKVKDLVLDQHDEIHLIYDRVNDKGNVDCEVTFSLEYGASESIRKYLILISLTFDTILKGHTLFVDNLDTRINESLLEGIIYSFQHQPLLLEAHLIFTTNNLKIDKFRLPIDKDKIMICYRTEDHQSVLQCNIN